MTEPTSAAPPPHPALKPLRNEPLRLLMAEEEGAYIADKIRATRRALAITAALGLTLPVLPVVLFWNDGTLLDRLFEQHVGLGLAGFTATLAGIAAPLWAGVRLVFDSQTLRRFHAYQADHAAFLAGHNRCPLDARRAKASAEKK